MNKINLMGRLCKHPEIKTTQSGTSVMSFTLAVDRQYKTKETDFIQCVAWRQTAEFIAKWFSKGQMMAVSGALQTRSYTDREGKDRTVCEVVVSDVYFCGDKSDKPKAEVATGDFVEIEYDEELPF